MRRARALHAWDGTAGVAATDLHFTVGQEFEIVSESAPGGGWYTGSIDGTEGIFPGNFVDVIEAPVMEAEPEPETYSSHTAHGRSSSVRSGVARPSAEEGTPADERLDARLQVQKHGKGDFNQARVQFMANPAVLLLVGEAKGSAIKSVGELKKQRKFKHAFRVDLEKPDTSGVVKYVFSMPSAEEKERWMSVLARGGSSLSRTSSEYARERWVAEQRKRVVTSAGPTRARWCSRLPRLVSTARRARLPRLSRLSPGLPNL